MGSSVLPCAPLCWHVLLQAQPTACTSTPSHLCPQVLMCNHFYGIHLEGDSWVCVAGVGLEAAWRQGLQTGAFQPPGASICLPQRKGVGWEETVLGSEVSTCHLEGNACMDTVLMAKETLLLWELRGLDPRQRVNNFILELRLKLGCVSWDWAYA